MSRARVALIVAVQCAALLAVCLFIGDNGWDDGAITLAFARTFARHGRISLTPQSEVVEGFSSVSWLLLNSLAALARPSYRAAILISQVLSVLSIGGCTLLLARSCRLLLLEGFWSAGVLIAFAAWGCSFSEAANGMEMGLLAAACLLIVNELLSPAPRLALLCAGVALALITRLEAGLYVALLGLSVAFVPGQRAFWTIVLAGFVTVALLSLWRFATFGDVLPNTYWAKRWPPYAAFTLGDRLAGGLELPQFFVVPLMALAIAGFRGGDLPGGLSARRRAVAVLAAPVLGAIGMGILTGKHWGYPGRMPYFAFPPGLLLLALALSEWFGAGGRRVRALVAVGPLLGAVAVSMTALPFAFLRCAAQGGSFGVTPHTYAQSGQVFRRVVAAAGRTHGAILTADVGGLALCCDEFRIVDLGLLSNRLLARQGPAAIGQVLAADPPELIEAHWRWAAVGNLYDQPTFQLEYVPAFSGRTKLWVRRDLAEAILGRGAGCWAPLQRDDVRVALQRDRYASTELPDDRRSFEAGGRVLALDQIEPGSVNLCRPGPAPERGR